MKLVRAQPFLKWAGGKRSLLSSILPHVPKIGVSSRYFEPFLGGGALFFAIGPSRAVLSDINRDLIETFVAVREDVESVIHELEQLPYSKDDYYRVRASAPATASARAARFIYLNKTCFNGLYRVNQQGKFNVPFGHHGPNLEICNLTQLRAASAALANARVVCDDFAMVLSDAQPGDVVYLDPPYTTSHSNNGFIEYNAMVFSWDDQSRLATTAGQLVSSGVHVLVSNADHPSIRDLYLEHGDFEIHEIPRWSTIAGRASKRSRITEVLLVGAGVAG